MDLQHYLDTMTVEGDLYEVVDADEKKIRCFACGHRCLIKDGGRGVCKVRFNQGGQLRVPHGYVGTLQVDPIEKKPFNHVSPGAQVISFGMLGCDFHCSYCFTPDTPIVTGEGVQSIGDLFLLGDAVAAPDGASVAFPIGLNVVSASGKFRAATKVFKHPYSGPIVNIKPYYLPSISCTPDHRVYATDDPSRPPEQIEARQLTLKHCLAVPRNYDLGVPQSVDVYALLSAFATTYKTPHKFTSTDVEYVLTASAEGMSSREIGQQLGKDPSYIRHVRSKIQRGVWTDEKPTGLIVEDNRVRLSKEHQPGIPTTLELDERLARLLGYYCAEGSVQKSKTRSNGHSLNFSFGLNESGLVEETLQLLAAVFGVQAAAVRRPTTLAVTTGKSSVALVFQSLCGNGSTEKHVPQLLFNAPPEIVTTFLDAYVRGDGHRTEQGKTNITTKSKNLAYGVAWLTLKTGQMISIYANDVGSERLIQGRQVKQAPLQYSVVWYSPHTSVKRKFTATDHYYLIPLRSIASADYEGPVYNLEVEEEHNYLANFMLVSNCQNWEISQHGRDKTAGRDPLVVSPTELVTTGKSRGATAFASTYNEPLITSEWAASVFKVARQAGMKTLFISNGNGTPEVIKYLRPWLDAYKIDLKTMQDKRYRELGGVLENVLDTIKLVKESGLWTEVVTLVIPGFNDSNEELWDAARYIASVSPDIPWHVTAFHPDYKMMEPPPTTVDTLVRAAEIGSEAGLRYVYAGNLPGRVGEWEDTYCPSCHATVVRRQGFRVLENKLIATKGHCPKCNTAIPGVWS